MVFKSLPERGCLSGQSLHHYHKARRNRAWYKQMKKCSLTILNPLGLSPLRGEQIYACPEDPAVQPCLCKVDLPLVICSHPSRRGHGRRAGWRTGLLSGAGDLLFQLCSLRHTWDLISFHSAALSRCTATLPDPSSSSLKRRREGPSSPFASNSQFTLFVVFLPLLDPENMPNVFFSVRICSCPFFICSSIHLILSMTVNVCHMGLSLDILIWPGFWFSNKQ